MKNKKFLCLVLALVMVLGAFGPVFAETKADDAKEDAEKVEIKKVTGRDNKIQYLVDNEYVIGRKVNEDPKDNDLALDKNIMRAEITKLLVYAIGRQDLAEKLQGTPLYKDVPGNHWASGVIAVGTTEDSPANKVHFLNGYPGNVFKPDDDVTYGELAKMLVVLVKKDLTQEMHDKANANNWPAQWMKWAAELGILEDVKIEDPNAPAVRADAFVMLYNALYALKYVHKYAATDELGILSQLKNKKLTLNQGEKKKEYTITDDTTFILHNQYNPLDVQADDLPFGWSTEFARVVNVWAVDNPTYYYGSLMRVITDDKGNVTHVLELGNPDVLALANTWAEDNPLDPGYLWNVADNGRWSGVAEGTMETLSAQNITTPTDAQGTPLTVGDRYVNAITAKFTPLDGTPTEIEFWQGDFDNSPLVPNPQNWGTTETDRNNLGPAIGPNVTAPVLLDSAKLDKNTRYFVADVITNQLTELDSLQEAIIVLGLNRVSNWFFDVYVGYDSVGDAQNVETAGPTNITGYNVAKVVVFNSVQIDNLNARLLRVKNEATRLYDATYEETDGTEVNFNLEKYRGAFPFNYDDEKFDVVEITESEANGIQIDPKIKHNDRGTFPIVKVIDVDSAETYMVVEDKNGHTARLGLENLFDKFLDKQKLKGQYIQFRTVAGNQIVDAQGNPLPVNETNRVEIVSILPKAYAEEEGLGVLQDTTLEDQGNQRAGIITLQDIDNSISLGGPGTPNAQVINVQMREYYNYRKFSDGQFNTDRFVDYDEALLLAFYLRVPGNDPTTFRYKVQDHVNNTKKAYDFEVLNLAGNAWIKIKDLVPAAQAVQAAIGNLPDAPNLDEPATVAARAAYDALTPDQKVLVDATILTDRETKIKNAKDAIATEAGLGINLTGAPYSVNTPNHNLDAVLAAAAGTATTDTTITRSNEALPADVDGTAQFPNAGDFTQTIKADFAKDGVTVPDQDVVVSYKVQ